MIKLALKASFEKESEIWVKVHVNLHKGLRNRKQKKNNYLFLAYIYFFVYYQLPPSAILLRFFLRRTF